VPNESNVARWVIHWPGKLTIALVANRQADAYERCDVPVGV
jgi:hypothetical protein